MKPLNLAVLNDLHLGAKREGGTTELSRLALRNYLLNCYRSLLEKVETDLLINGDWLDAFSIDVGDLLKVYDITCDWLKCTGLSLFAAQGNHDVAKDSTKTSSFILLAELLKRRFPSQVTIITEPVLLPKHDAYIIPHLRNQELFDAAMQQVPSIETLYVHCNYDNQFAVHSDHSLNMSEEQAKLAPVAVIVFGHEHQGRTALKGKVQVVGNQFPSSVADCLGNSAFGQAVKWMWQNGERTPVWSPEGQFEEQDWQTLQNGPKFVRVTGTASASQASDVIAAIARFRATSDAFVITNAVQIAGLDDNESLSVSLEEIKAFSVLDALLKILTPEEGDKVKKLLKEQHVG